MANPATPPIPPAPSGMPGPVAPPAAAPSPSAANVTKTVATEVTPSAPGAFRLDVQLNSLQFYYDPTAPGQITQEQLDLVGQIRRTESTLKSIFYPGGLPDDLRLNRPPARVESGTHASRAHKVEKAPEAEVVDLAKKDDKPAKKPKISAKERKNLQKKTKFRSYFYALFLLGEIGLQPPSPQPNLARSSLASLKDQILVLEGGRIKNRYMFTLGIAGLELGAIPFAWIVVHELWKMTGSLHVVQEASVYKIALVMAFAWVGAMIGTFLSYALRNTVLTFDQLAVPEEDRMNPNMRLIYVGLLTEVLILALLLHVGSITLGSVKTDNLTLVPTLALFIGVLCGVAERALGGWLLKTADTIGK